MKIKKCGCKHCKRGLHTKSAGDMVTKRRRAARHKAKQALNKGVEIDPETGEPVLVEEPDTEFDIPYTD